MTTAGSLAHWALSVRDHAQSTRVNAKLAQCVTPQLVSHALTVPAIAARLEPLPAHQRPAALRALSVIARNRHLRHTPEVTLGASLRALHGSTQAAALALAAGSSQTNAVRILGSAVARAGKAGPVNLVEFVDLLTAWDGLSLPLRSRFLVDFHAACRA